MNTEFEQSSGKACAEDASADQTPLTDDIEAVVVNKEDIGYRDAAHEWLVRWLVLAAVLTISALYVGFHLRNGWVPADEGTLAQSALRALQGQLPHRDYAEIYTGGLSLIHALAFRLFGVTLMSLRICVFLFFLAWIPSFYSIAVRFTSPIGAALVTLLAVAWSFPNYPAAMPSWYNLFLATFGAAALLRYLEVRKARWLFGAGVCGGVSILIKVIGAYYIAAALLFLAFVEQGDHDSDDSHASAVAYRIFSGSALALFLVSVLYLLRTRWNGGELYDFAFPAAILVAVVFWSESMVRNSDSIARFRALFRMLLPFIGGALTPVIIFLLPYARSGSVHTIFSGAASSVISRAGALGRIRPAGVEQVVYAVALLAIVAAAMYMHVFQSKLIAMCIGLGFAVVLYQSGQRIVTGVWYSVAMLTPLVVAAGAAVIWTAERSGSLTKLQRQRIMLLISVAGICSFVQYPFAAPIYLSYCLPLTLLAALAIIETAKRQAGTYILAVVAGFYLLFALDRLVPDYIYELTHKVGTLQELHIQRAAGLRVEFAPDVEEFVRFLQERAPNGLLYAANDCPEVYFLTGLKNVTRDDTGSPPDEVLRALDSSDVREVVINEAPFFPGGRMNAEVRAAVVQKFPESRQMGIFHVYWRR